MAAALVACMAAAGCASLGGPAFVPSPEEVPALEARVRANPDDAQALTRLGAAYESAGRLDQAAEVLQRAVVSDPESANAHFILGLVFDAQERFADAGRSYGRYLELAPDSRLRGQVEGRLELARRNELRVAVRESLAREQQLAARPSPATVAVFPFLFSGSDERLRPLGRALAEMLTTDLAQTDRLTVLERVQVQALLDEVELGQSGVVDPATAARGGRLLGAGRVVQGQVSGNEQAMTLEAAVVQVGATGDPGTVRQQDAGGRFFEMEKALAFQIYEEMGVSLAPAERERVGRRLTENLQALLAFGRGLEASDAGRFSEARQFFQQAVQLDPRFQRANQLAGSAADLERAASTSTSDAAEEVATASVEADIAAEVAAVASQAAAAATRNPAQEALGTEGVGKNPATSITVILKRPGGDR
jgi:tetratricopeptide (TPR) repeat protein